MLQELEKAIGYTFHNIELLRVAVTHTSYANESKKGEKHNERLEFLGASVLGVVVADYLFHEAGHLPEGQLTRKRASLVCEQALFGFAQQIQLGKYLRLGKGEERSGGRQRPSILSDAFEAVIAAIYLDGGQARRGGLQDPPAGGSAAEPRGAAALCGGRGKRPRPRQAFCGRGASQLQLHRQRRGTFQKNRRTAGGAAGAGADGPGLTKQAGPAAFLRVCKRFSLCPPARKPQP